MLALFGLISLLKHFSPNISLLVDFVGINRLAVIIFYPVQFRAVVAYSARANGIKRKE